MVHRRPKRVQQTGPRIFWSGLRPMYDYWGAELKRHYKLETLASATEHHIETRDRFILSSVESVLGPVPISRLYFELFQEGRYQLIFQMRAENIRRNHAEFGLVVAKNHEESSKVANAEYNNLRRLQPRAPQWVVKPYSAGSIFLPDRHGRKEHGREIFAYVTQWLKGYDELGINDNLQFYTNVPKRHTFTKAETEMLKGQMVQIVTALYDPGREEGIALPEIASGDFVVQRASHGAHKLKLIACRRLQPHLSPPKLIHKMLTASWPWGGKRFCLAPEEPETFYDGLAKSAGKEQVREWLRKFLAGARAGRYAGVAPEYLETLREIVTE